LATGPKRQDGLPGDRQFVTVTMLCSDRGVFRMKLHCLSTEKDDSNLNRKVYTDGFFSGAKGPEEVKLPLYAFDIIHGVSP